MTTKVEPTVEKWEKLGSLGLSETQKKAISYMHFHSVQEAKAEMIAKIEGMKYTYPEKDSGWTTRNGKAKLDTVSYNAALEDLIASLKQEEEKVC